MILYDCHAHVFEEVSVVPTARYTPTSPAPLKRWLEHINTNGLKGGVIVQVSFLGTDNSELCTALEQLSSELFAGVAVVSTSVHDEEIDRLYSLGVRGFRWNLVGGLPLPDLQNREVKAFLERVYRRDMHVEIHLESPRLAQYISPLLDFGGVVVVDHLGLPSAQSPYDDPWIQTIKRIKNISGLYVKFSGHYRTPFDTSSHASTLLAQLLPDRIVWGSDWPHTQYESAINYQSVALARNELQNISDEKAVQSLYGLK